MWQEVFIPGKVEHALQNSLCNVDFAWNTGVKHWCKYFSLIAFCYVGLCYFVSSFHILACQPDGLVSVELVMHEFFVLNTEL